MKTAERILVLAGALALASNGLSAQHARHAHTARLAPFVRLEGSARAGRVAPCNALDLRLGTR